MSNRLGALLSPVPAATFLSSFRNREHLHVSRNVAGFYDPVVSLTDLDVFFQFGLLPATMLSVVSNGVRRPLEDWSQARKLARRELAACSQERLFKLYAEGSTLILNCAGETIPSLAETCRELSRELGHPVQANIYMTPPNAQGFSRHEDDHEVMILQIYGRKSWLVYPRKDAAPVELEMRDGDLLFIPMGMGHEAKCSVHGSIHVTVGLHPTYGYQLVEALAAVARDRPQFQLPVPSRLDCPEAWEAFEANFLDSLRILLAQTPQASLMERRFSQFVDTQRLGWPGRLTDILHLREITDDTVLCARATMNRRIEDCGSSLVVQTAGHRITVPGFLRQCLDRMLDDTAFTVKDLPGMFSAGGKVEFVRPFVANGLLSIVKVGAGA